jgi:hypothetical protein
MPWQEIESSLAHRFARAAKAGKQIEDIDLFGATVSWHSPKPLDIFHSAV